MSTPAVDQLLARASLALPVLTVLLATTDRTRRRLRDAGHDTGASVLEVVVISAIFLTIALTVGAILTGKFTGKANQLDLTTPTGNSAP